NLWGKTAVLFGEVSSPKLASCVNADRPVPGFGRSVSLSGDTLAVGAFDWENPVAFGKVTRNLGTHLFQHSSPGGWRQLTTLAPPSFCDDFGPVLVSLGGPDLLLTNNDRWFVHERNLTGAGRWGRRTRRPEAEELHITDLAVRGNLIAFGDRGEDAAWIYERDVPARNRWGRVARLSSPELPWAEGTKVAIGPREVVTLNPEEDILQIFPRAPILADDFESGGTGAWSGRRGQVEVVGPGLQGSGAALAVTAGGNPRASFVATNRPRREPSVSLEFSLFVNDVELLGRRVDILRFYAGKPVLRLQLEGTGADCEYAMHLGVRQRDGSWREVAQLPMPCDEEERFTVEYRSATGESTANGFARLSHSYDIVQRRNLDTGRMVVNRVVLGLPVGSPAAASGSFIVDGFEMHR
ncbi:MAG: hypothetical protein ACE5EG_10170, partial [Thermoanaerobaculia bacterium]